MKLVKLRFRISKLGLTLEEVGDRWAIDNGCSIKNRVYQEFANLEEVETWLKNKEMNHDDQRADRVGRIQQQVAVPEEGQQDVRR